MVGSRDGAVVGKVVGSRDGAVVGKMVGSRDGAVVGKMVGSRDGAAVGTIAARHSQTVSPHVPGTHAPTKLGPKAADVQDPTGPSHAVAELVHLQWGLS